ncbi:MAG: DsbE family thiol:disulfide interchange protein [Pelagibacteraceae bacterium]|nr:DsbE family thiol:disulfide interchange protein [Pelagibacteraceae bacterium]
MNKVKVFIIPFFLILIIIFIALNLNKNDKSKIKIQYNEIPISIFEIPDFINNKTIDTELRKNPYIINFFASWCGPCLAEHPILMNLKEKGVKIIGINFRDDENNLREWLKNNGNPFEYIIIDNGDIAFELGLIGVPETYFIKKDKIFNKIQGPLFEDDIEKFL